MFSDIKDFYPTPLSLIHKMLNKIDFNTIKTVLEPSAGDGRIVQAVADKFKYKYSSYSNKETKWDIDCIEINQNLQFILLGKNYRVVHDNFLTYDSYKHYDLIVANFPFSDDDKHLHKALDLQERVGGKIICLINAETIRNPFSNSRQYLVQRLERHNATIEYIENGFYDAERKTGVTVALIHVDIPKLEHNSMILEDLRQEENFREESDYNSNKVINADFLKGIVEQYNFEVKAGLKLIAEWESLKTNMFKGCQLEIICSKDINDRYKDSIKDLHNSYIKDVRAKYWRALFENEKFMGLFTSNLRNEYYNKVKELCDYDFSLYNIYTIKLQLNKHMVQSMEDTILSLFDEFSQKHYWDSDTVSNIHYYNGWKTNKSWKINKKIIIPLAGFIDMQYSWGRYNPTHYKIIDKLTDIEKVLNYLDGGLTEDVNITETLKMAEHYQETKKIQLKYFMVTFYKKGTCHIEFTNDELLHKFNLFGSQKKGWLPPVYGNKKYKDMTSEEKQAIDEFEGELSYNRVMNNTDYYIVDNNKLLMLAEG